RFQKRMQEVGVDDWDAYRTFLAEHTDEFAELFNTILINVTGFFRDREAWTVVGDEVLPRLLEERGDAPIRVCSAGCASGEEPSPPRRRRVARRRPHRWWEGRR